LKHPDGVEVLLQLVQKADAIIEGFRPGVMERLGVGPDKCLARNPKIIFGRMTGWGQEGWYSQAAGHDINYISLAGALAHFARAGEAPVPPLNMVGDFGGGGMFLALGILAALLEAQKSGEGQVVDAAMVDGTAVLMTFFWAFKHVGLHDENKPGTNLLDTGAHFYDVYECKDGKYVSIGSIEPQFYAELLQMDRTKWPAMKEKVRAVFATKTREEWCSIMEATDVCFAPVLTMSEAAKHRHNVERGTFVESNGRLQPAPAPRFSRTTPSLDLPPAHPGQHTRQVLESWGITNVDALLSSGAARQA
jgi:alpha-methylacyl-CoA racemase